MTVISPKTASRRACAAVLLAAGLLCIRGAHAETRLVSGSQLVLSTSSSEDVAIDTDPSLHGQVRLSLDAGLSCLSISSGNAVTVSTSRCNDESGRLRIDVSPDAAVTLSSSGDGDVRVADLHGALTATLSGSGDLVTGRTGPLVLSVRASGDATLGDVYGPAVIDITGNGDVHIKDVHGPLTVRQVGSGDLVAGGIQGGNVVVDGSGSGDILLGAGHIQALQARMNGSGDLSIAAGMDEASVDARGGGDVKLGPVSGALNQTASDGSDVVVLDAAQARAIGDQVARKLGSGTSGSRGGMQLGAHEAADLESFLTFAFVVLVLFICWRIVRRAGGLSGLRGPAAALPSNPGVLALGETMTRLEQRLGRLESYVTTREFDLARKFRELGPQ